MSAFNHVGQCVTDLDRSKRFYCELFDFVVEREINPPDEGSAQLLSLTPPVGMTACYLVRDGLVLELLHFAAPGQTQEFRARTMNEPGLTHISLSVDDIDDGVLTCALHHWQFDLATGRCLTSDDRRLRCAPVEDSTQ